MRQRGRGWPVIDPHINRARALVVDSQPRQATLVCAQLRDLGVRQVVSVRQPAQARRLLEKQSFDIIIGGDHVDSAERGAQDLLDELRRDGLLPPETVFLMLTPRAAYHQVVEAAGALPDGILVRPCSTHLLGQRLRNARHRKRELAGILRALHEGESEQALVQALRRYQEKRTFGSYCGRLAAELLLARQRPDDARRLFEALVEPARTQPWARLGVARAQLAAADGAGAQQTLAAVLAEDPRCADAHELLGRLLVDHGDLDAAWEACRRAAELTPGCLLRAQHAGTLAFYQGRRPEAAALLQKAVNLSDDSRLFDALTWVLLAILRYDDADIARVRLMHEQLVKHSQRTPGTVRLQRLEQAAAVLRHWQAGEHDAALLALRTGSAQAGDDDFDLEAASLVLALWSRLPPDRAPAAEQDAVTDRIARRFCVSHAVSAMLMAATRPDSPAAARVRACQSEVLTQAEQAIERALTGDAVGAAQTLLAQAEQTLNGKLLQLAGAIASRHGAQAEGSQAVQELARALERRTCGRPGPIGGLQHPGRTPGALPLRARPAAEVADATG